MADNYDDVVGQIIDAGLKPSLPLLTGKMVRCKVGDDHEKRGWYILHDLTLGNGNTVIVGSFGQWRGNENNTQKVELKKTELSAEQKAAIKTRLAEDRKRSEAARKAEQAKAARIATSWWRNCSATGEHDYLIRKGVQGYDVRYSKKGALVIPMRDVSGQVHGLQFILSRTTSASRINRTGRDKEFQPPGLAKKGHFHMIGLPTTVCLIGEGYATMASLHAATGLPAVVAFDAGNILPVAEVLKKRYPHVKWLICADDDSFGTCMSCQKPVKVAEQTCPHCGNSHQRTNAGVSAASNSALAVNGAWVSPKFAADDARWAKFQANGTKITDFNDLHLSEGLATVRVQIEAAIEAAGFKMSASVAREEVAGGAGKAKLVAIQTTEEIHERYALIYGHGSSVFDFQERMLLAMSDMRDLCTHRETHRRWAESPEKIIVRISEVGFDPSEKDKNITCNLWGGWPTSPKAGECYELISLLQHLCSGEDNGPEMFKWVLNWLAFPIQNPGAKMKTALVLHGPQGTGKNLFFESYMAIFGEYGRVVDQSAIEDKFNDWASKRLFLIADEVVARQELFHVKNKLKHLITGDWIRINPKNVTAYDEKNHVNLVFLSNESQPLVLEKDDRRYTIIWTPGNLPADTYKKIGEEVKSGGIEALHDYLLNLDLGDFNEHTKPPSNKAKQDLIDVSLDSVERFFDDLQAGRLTPLDGKTPCLTSSLYDVYKIYCNASGVGRPTPLHQFSAKIGKRVTGKKEVARYHQGGQQKMATFWVPPGVEQSVSKSKPEWLGASQDRFVMDARDWKGSNVEI